MARGTTIIAVPPSGQMAQIGTDHRRGVWAEGISWDHSLPDKGARQAQFTLRRKPEQEWPDLQPFTDIQIYKGGSVGFTGRIQQTPTIRGRENSITVICEGWPAHAKDDAIEKLFVHNDLTAWRDARSYTQASLAVYTSAYQVEVGGIPAIRVSNGTTVPNGAAGGITLDAGPYNTIKHVGMSVIGGGHAGFALRWLAGDLPAALTEFGVVSGPPIVTAATPANFTLVTPRRYVTLYMDVNALTNVALDTAWVQLLNIVCYSDTAYGTGTTPILKASQVIPAVLPYTPKISQSTIGITTTTFSIPHFVGPVTNPGDYIDAANDYHGFQVFFRDAADGGKPFTVFRAVPSSPALVANVGNGIEFNDASRNDGSEIYNRVIVEYTDAAGNTARVERSTGGLPNAIADPDIVVDAPSAAVTIPNPSFDSSTAGWTVGVGTLTRDTGVFDTTPASGRATADGTGISAITTTITGLTVGRRYAIQLRLRATAAISAGGPTINMAQVPDIGPAGLLFGPGGSTSAPVGSFGTYRATFTAPTATLILSLASAGTISVDHFYVDSIQFFEARPTIVDKQGFVRTKVLATGSRLTAAAAQQIGDIYLQAHRFTPLRGSLTVQGPAIRTLLGGAPIPANMLGRGYLGDAILINETDPDLGSIGRVGIINAVTYDEATDTAQVSIDANKDFVDQLLARLQVFS